VDPMLIERLDRLQRLEHAADELTPRASARVQCECGPARGRRTPAVLQASLVASSHQDRAVISTARGRRALDTTPFLGREQRQVHEPQFTAGVVAVPALRDLIDTLELIFGRSQRLFPLPHSATTSMKRVCRSAEPAIQSGSAAIRPGLASIQESFRRAGETGVARSMRRRSVRHERVWRAAAAAGPGTLSVSAQRCKEGRVGAWGSSTV
jgi:hypothetical protein